MNYKRGDIVVVKFPFILKEGAEKQKGRPALVISDDKYKRRYNDIILAAITSQIPHEILESEVVIESTALTGLKQKSLLRLDFLMTIPEDLVSRKIGILAEEIMAEVEKKLKIIFGIK